MRETLRTIIFGTQTKAGRAFDILLIIAIGLSVLFTMVDSIPVYNEAFGDIFNQIEWGFTILFTVEYLVRIFCSIKATRYVFSFLGFIDFLAILLLRCLTKTLLIVILFQSNAARRLLMPLEIAWLFYWFSIC